MLNLEKLKGITRDDVLARIGLQERESSTAWILPAATMFGIGLLIGAGLGLMLAPKSGRELRGTLRRRLRPASRRGEAVLDPPEAPGHP